MKPQINLIIKSPLFKFTIINIIASILLYFVNKPFWFNENQILYIFSTMAQVTGGLFGLTLAAYTLIDDKLKKIGDKEDSADASKQVRLDSFENLKQISLLSIFCIALSMLVISTYRNYILEISIFFMLEATTLFILLLYRIYDFIKVANPNNIEKEKETSKQELEAAYKSPSTTTSKSLGSFITYYNLLEIALKDLAQKLISKSSSALSPQIIDALDILKDNEVISAKCYAQINDLRIYRNTLVHSIDNDKSVNGSLYEILEKTYNLFHPIVDAYNDNQTLDFALISALNQYIDTLPLTIDMTLFSFLIEHPSATLRDISGSLNIPPKSVHAKLEKLISYGLLTKHKSGRYTVWKPTRDYISNTFSFDYSNNNGEYVINNGTFKFTTKWDKSSDISIHAYSDASDIECIAVIKNPIDLVNITLNELSSLDYSSRCRNIKIGEIAVWKNKYGHYLLTLVKTIHDDSRGDKDDLLECEYRILING